MRDIKIKYFWLGRSTDERRSQMSRQRQQTNCGAKQVSNNVLIWILNVLASTLSHFTIIIMDRITVYLCFGMMCRRCDVKANLRGNELTGRNEQHGRMVKEWSQEIMS